MRLNWMLCLLAGFLLGAGSGCEDEPPPPGSDGPGRPELGVDGATDGGGACTGPEQCPTRNCQGGQCVEALPSCADGVWNGLESDADCGGPLCGPCTLGSRCGEPADCITRVCLEGICASAPATCNDGEQNSGESDTDCGHVCPERCLDGQHCLIAADCASGVCGPGGSCAPPGCGDGVKNGTETDVDCGGSCPQGCAVGQVCAEDGDCQSGDCSEQKWCVAAACDDGVKNGGESDVDCGGSCSQQCAVGQSCASGADCQSGFCPGGVCAVVPATCSDGVQNGTESDVDCGKDCPTRCADGKTCQAGADCQSRCCPAGSCAACPQLLLEAEAFTTLGGWRVDSQFVETMGSAYLLAHGLGQKVAPATRAAIFPAAGSYRLWVRTRDWVPPHHPGTFKVAVGGQALPTLFGTRVGWGWQDGGTVTVGAGSTTIALQDQTGFDGRCDALYFTMDPAFTPPDGGPALLTWRRQLLGLPATPPAGGSFDLIVVGGGIAGASATLAAARRGLAVALIHDRAVVGGNASQEVRVHTCGYRGEGFVGGIVDELDWDQECQVEPAGSDNAVGYDVKRLQKLTAEPKVTLLLEHRAVGVTMAGAKIASVDALSTRSGEVRRFSAPLFVDATGDGWIGYWAGASFRMGREAQSEFGESLAPGQADQVKLGTSVLWQSVETASATTFPDVSAWTAPVVKGFHASKGDWTWEYGITASLSTIDHAEEIRDHLLRAAFGAFYNEWSAHGGGKRQLSWVAHVAGKRESRRLVGDYLLREADIRQRVAYPDTAVVGSWPIDLHFPNGCLFCCPSCPKGCVPQCFCAGCGPACELDFISRCEQTHVYSYGVPFRSLYSKNVENLMMAGRDLSATHVALGGTRVQNTNGQMGAVAAVAAELCKKYGTTPRGVYQSHLTELITTATGMARPLGVLLRNGYVQSDGQQSWSQTCAFSGGGLQDCGIESFASWGPPAIATDPGTFLSDRYTFVYRVAGARKLRNGFVQSNGAKSWSQTCDIDGAGSITGCGGFSTYGPPAAITPDGGQGLNARYAFVVPANGGQVLHNGFVQSDGKKSWSQACSIDPATGSVTACNDFVLETLPPAGVTPDPGTFISDRYAFVYRAGDARKLRDGYQQSDGKKSWSRTCSISPVGSFFACGSFTSYGPPAGLAPAPGTSASRRYVFTLDPY